jgi:hypothetical protein
VPVGAGHLTVVPAWEEEAPDKKALKDNRRIKSQRFSPAKSPHLLNLPIGKPPNHPKVNENLLLYLSQDRFDEGFILKRSFNSLMKMAWLL